MPFATRFADYVTKRNMSSGNENDTKTHARQTNVLSGRLGNFSPVLIRPLNDTFSLYGEINEHIEQKNKVIKICSTIQYWYVKHRDLAHSFDEG